MLCAALGSGGSGGYVNIWLHQGTFFYFSPRNQPSLAVFLTLTVFITAMLSELLKLHSGRGAGGRGGGGMLRGSRGWC